MINTSSDLLKTVVNDVLDYAKLESGNIDVKIENTNLQQMLDSVVLAAVEQKIAKKNVKARTFYGVSLPEFVDTDSQRL